jgi:hypothetical protein
MKYKFNKDTQSGLIFVTIVLEDIYELKMVLDTGASHTTVDFTPLCMAGYTFGHAVKTTLIETGNGIIDADVFEVESSKTLWVGIYKVKNPLIN